MRNKDKKYIESWDNYLLKNILPQNIKCHEELGSYERNIPKRGLATLNINIINDKDNKYNSEKKYFVNEREVLYIFINKN